MSDIINDYFSTIKDSLAAKIHVNVNDDLNKFNTLVYCQNSIFLSAAFNNDIFAIISSMNVNKVPGHNNISDVSLKRCAETIVPFPCDIYNACIVTSIDRDSLKISNITPVCKAEGTSGFKNYRPIFVLPVINKVLEKLTFRNVLNFLNSQNFFYFEQYGFKANCGTHNALLELVNLLMLIKKVCKTF